jgi:hypothetical protein
MLILKQKICKCGKLAMRNRRICYHCDCEKRKAKRIAEAQKWAEKRAKKKARFEQGETYRKRLFKKAWELQSKAMRKLAARRDGYVQCYTCGKVMRWQDAHIGHYFHGRLDFDPRNLRIQGACCNTYKHGNLAVYGAKLAEEGIDLKQLLRDAEEKGNDYSIAELKEIIDKFTL